MDHNKKSHMNANNPVLHSNENPDLCSICLIPLGDGQKNLIGPYTCAHQLHTSCWSKWEQAKQPSDCPLCRSPPEYPSTPPQERRNPTLLDAPERPPPVSRLSSTDPPSLTFLYTDYDPSYQPLHSTPHQEMEEEPKTPAFEPLDEIEEEEEDIPPGQPRFVLLMTEEDVIEERLRKEERKMRNRWEEERIEFQLRRNRLLYMAKKKRKIREQYERLEKELEEEGIKLEQLKKIKINK